MDRIRDRVAIVTGASRGIGWEIARLLVADGAFVVAAARDEKRLHALVDKVGAERCVPVVADVTEPAQIQAMVALAIERFGRVEILVNNAGIGLSGIVADMNVDDLERIFAVNVFGAVRCIQACVPHMRTQGWGHIVNISSILGKRSVPQTAGYAATKFALHALSDGLRIEEAPHGIVVTVVCPGSTETDFRENEIKSGTLLLSERPRMNSKSAEHVAKKTLAAIRRKKREVYVSPFGALLGAMEKISPSAVDMVLKRTYHK